MKKLFLTIILLGLGIHSFAEQKMPEVKLRDLNIEGMMIQKGQLLLTLTFDVRKEKIFDELTFDFYLLLEPQDNDFAPQFLHCRTAHRYLEKKSSQKSCVVLKQSVLDCIKPRSGCKYAVVAIYRGKEVGVENSEKERWWEDPALGEPVENVLTRWAEVPIVREWESGGE